MMQTVIGVFDSYVDASSAQRALVDANFAPGDIAVYSTATVRARRHGPRAYARGAGNLHHGPVAGPLEQRESLEQLERLFARTFHQGEYPLETESYREAIRRGAAIVSVDASDTEVDAAQAAMTRMGALDIDELAAGWRRDDSLSGIVASQAVPPSAADMPLADAPPEPGFAANTTTERSFESVRTPGAMRSSESMPDSVSRNMNGGPGAGREEFEPGNPVRAGGAGVTAATPASGRPFAPAGGTQQNRSTAYSTPEDDYSLYEDEFRRDYDSRYAETGAPYQAYQQAYRHGAAVGRDERYREYDWPDVEADVRRHWETSYPDSGWDRFKAAVRHGWARVTGRE
jgi:hypothetical protein